MQNYRRWLVMGFWMSICATAHATPYDALEQHTVLQKNRMPELNVVHELPLYVPGPDRISFKGGTKATKNGPTMMDHIFIQRTKHAFALGARVMW